MRKIVTVAAAVCLLWLGLGATPAPAQYRDGGGRLGMRRARTYDGGYRNYGFRNRNRGYGNVSVSAPFVGVDVNTGNLYYSDPYAGYPVVPTAGDNRQSFFSPAGMSNRATVRVALPSPNAKVYFDDEATTQPGTDRVYNTPTLEPAKSYTYTIRATWMEDGKEVTKTKDVKVQAGRDATVNFRTQ
jgi:uncharacterized protein (TIGR03000 family)